MFEENGVGTGPSAPDSAEEGGEIIEGEGEAGDDEKAEPEVLGGEGDPEEVEAEIGGVEEDGGVAVDGNPGEGDVDEDEDQSGEASPVGEGSAHVGGVQHLPRSILGDGGDAVEIGGDGGHDGVGEPPVSDLVFLVRG